jgi:hypothetical protein
LVTVFGDLQRVVHPALINSNSPLFILARRMRSAKASSHRLLRNRPSLRINRVALQIRQGDGAPKPSAQNANLRRRMTDGLIRGEAASRFQHSQSSHCRHSAFEKVCPFEFTRHVRL